MFKVCCVLIGAGSIFMVFGLILLAAGLAMAAWSGLAWVVNQV